MTDTVRQLAPTILEKIKASQHILLHCHPKPDPDSVGSVLAMKYALEGLGKKVTALRGDSEIPKAFGDMPGFSTFTPKNFIEFDLSTVDTFISLDSGSTDMISRVAPVVFPSSLTVIVIDHHNSNKGYGSLNLVDYTYPATCQMLADVFECWNIRMTREIATNLVMGIYTDTGGFKYRGVTSDTFKIISKLTEVAPDFHKAIFNMENSNTPDSIAFIGKALSSIDIHCGGILAISSIEYSFIKDKGLNVEDLSSDYIPNQLKSVIGWDVAVFLIESKEGFVKVSMRTRNPDKYDLSVIALALGGGGHKAAAGALIKGSIEEAKKMVVTEVEKMLK